ncbi:MAG: glycosyltransferase family 4 protein [Candidatus Microgenomates bacterium]|jgi:glycosyltransferase involved in cell wall biosynthesis
MKILFLNKYQNKVSRGAETFVCELSKRLSKNHEVDVVSEINYFNILKKKYDFIIPTNGRFQAVIVRKIAWLTGAKVIISGQSGLGFDDRINLYTFPDAFVGLTTYQFNWAKKVNPFVKVVTISNGVDLKKFSVIKSKPENIVLSVGAFTVAKRHDLTIRAVEKLENTKLIIVGGGGDKKQEITDLGLKTLGKDGFEVVSITHDKMPEIYKKADVLAFPTVPWESFGIAMVEAMATGLPVVATNDPIRHEIVGDAGILVDPTNTEEYAEALQKALDTNWGNKPRKQAEKFSWDEIAEKYDNLFKELTK